MGTIIQNKMNAKNDTVNIQKNHEYILAYRKQAIFISGTKIKPTLVNREERLRPAFEENGCYYYINDAITTRGEGGTLNARPNLGYTVYYNPSTMDKIAVADYDIEKARTSNSVDIYHHDEQLMQNGYIAILPPTVRGKLGCWTWSIDKFNSNKQNIVITGGPKSYAVKKRTFVDKSSVEEQDGKLFYVSTEEKNSRSIIEFSTNDGTKTLTSVMEENATFSNPKNLDMISYLLSLKENDAIVLDFFAGSGTTAHAVLKWSNSILLCRMLSLSF